MNKNLVLFILHPSASILRNVAVPAALQGGSRKHLGSVTVFETSEFWTYGFSHYLPVSNLSEDKTLFESSRFPPKSLEATRI
jgi:hypothetical protein